MRETEVQIGNCGLYNAARLGRLRQRQVSGFHISRRENL